MTNHNETAGVGSNPYVSPVRRTMRPWAWMEEANDVTEPRAGQIMVDLLIKSLQSDIKESDYHSTETNELSIIEDKRESITYNLHRCLAYRRGNNAAIARGEIFPIMLMTEISRQPPSPKAVVRMRAITDRMYWMGSEPPKISSVMVYYAMLDNLERWNDARPEAISPIRVEEVFTWLSRWLYVIDILIWRRDHGSAMPPREATII